MSTPANTEPIAGDSPITKIGTEVFGLRVVSGYLHAADPGQILLRQLYPGKPANIGRIEMIGSTASPGTGRLTINADRAAEWSEHERIALAAFFLTRYTDRIIKRPTATPPHLPNRGRGFDDRSA
jgi:hypothetical protein